MGECIVISDDENSDESHPVGDLASLREEDLTNTRPGAISALANLLENDENNVPDAFGRVSLNPMHAKNEDDIFVAFHIGKQLKKHQISGIRFMYSNLIGSIPHFNAGLSGAGCILAHSMGLGKTLEVVAFLEALFRSTKLEKCLIVTPANTIRLWYAEFNKWLPEKPPANNANTIADNDDVGIEGVVEVDEDDRYRTFNLFFIDDECKTFEDKFSLISNWKSGGGVLLLGYEMLLSIYKNAKKRVQSTTRKEQSGGYVHLRHKEKVNADEKRSLMETRKREFELIVKALLNHGPDIVVCDEGHRLKSENAEVVQLMRKIRTKRRLVLTGYPLQNNLLEYWYMVDFIRPGHLGPVIQFKDLFVAPIQRGSAADSVPVEVVQMRQRTHILYSLLKGFVHRRPALLLYQHLPPKYEYILSLKMTSFQARIYNVCVAKCSMTGGLLTRNLFRAFAISMKIANHPDVFCRFVNARAKEGVKEEEEDEAWSGEEDFIDDRSVASKTRRREKGTGPGASASGSASSAVNANRTNQREEGGDLVQSSEWANWLSVAKRAGYQEDSKNKEEEYGYDMKWALPLIDGYTPKCNPEDSPKFRVLFCLIKHSVLAGDRMLVFSQNLSTLDLVEKILQKSVKPHAILASSIDDDAANNNPENLWRPNVDYFRFDGSTPGSSREILINRFQQTKGARGVKVENNNAGDAELVEEKVALNSNQAVLFLISTRAGSLGINLTGANRVCLMDASWNPCQDVQALSRVYRFGQLKPCFVYRLVSDCSLERVVYDRQVHKEALSTRVVDDSPVNRRFSREDIKNIYRHYPEDAVVPSSPPTDPKEQAESLMAGFSAPVVDSVLNSVLRELSFLFARAPQRHDTFREIDPTQRLTDLERRRALLQYEVDKTEYEQVVLPAFSKNSRGGGKKRRKSDSDSDESEQQASERARHRQNAPASSSSFAIRPPFPPPPPIQPRLNSESLLSSLITTGSTYSTVGNTQQQSVPSTSVNIGGLSSLLSNVLTGGNSTPSSLPPPPPVPPPPPNRDPSPPPIALPTPVTSSAIIVQDSFLAPIPALPLYCLPAVPSSSYQASSRLPAPPGFSSSGITSSSFPMPLSSRLPSLSQSGGSSRLPMPPPVPLSVYALPPLPQSRFMRPPRSEASVWPTPVQIPQPRPQFHRSTPPVVVTQQDEVIEISDDDD